MAKYVFVYYKRTYHTGSTVEEDAMYSFEDNELTTIEFYHAVKEKLRKVMSKSKVTIVNFLILDELKGA